MTFENLLYDCSDGIASVTVNRPKALNALNEATLKELLSLFAAIGDDAAVKVVILTGSGEKAFVAGADIAEMQPIDAVTGRQFALLGHQLAAAIGGSGGHGWFPVGWVGVGATGRCRGRVRRG